MIDTDLTSNDKVTKMYRTAAFVEKRMYDDIISMFRSKRLGLLISQMDHLKGTLHLDLKTNTLICIIATENDRSMM